MESVKSYSIDKQLKQSRTQALKELLALQDKTKLKYIWWKDKEWLVYLKSKKRNT